MSTVALIALLADHLTLVVLKPLPYSESEQLVSILYTLPGMDIERAGLADASYLHYRDRTGEVYSLTFSDAHRWYYYPRMQADEVLLLKCFDSDAGCARFTAHTAFDDPTTGEDAPRRESIEVRTLAFFEPSA